MWESCTEEPDSAVTAVSIVNRHESTREERADVFSR